MALILKDQKISDSASIIYREHNDKEVESDVRQAGD